MRITWEEKRWLNYGDLMGCNGDLTKKNMGLKWLVIFEYLPEFMAKSYNLIIINDDLMGS